MKNIVLDAMGVIYQAGDDVAELLFPFLRCKGCGLAETEIEEQYIKCSLGEFNSATFWKKMGLDEDAEVPEQEYLAGHDVNDGLFDFLDFSIQNGSSIAVISNDVSEWSMKLRAKFNLDNWITHYCISGDVGCRKPDASIFNCFLEKTGFNPEDCLFVDDRVKNLDTAKRAGFITVCFLETPEYADTIKHQSVATFNELKALVTRL